MGGRSRHPIAVAAIAAAIGGGVTSAWAADTGPQSASDPTPEQGPGAGYGGTTDVKLSDEFKLSRWAYPALRARVRSEPRPGAKAIAQLHYNTEDGFPEVYLLLSQHVDSHGNAWVRLRVPGRPNGRTGWVPRDALGPFNVTRKSLLVNRRTLRATLFDKGKKVWSARIGVGKRSTPTPGGHYWIREKFRVRNAPFYGPYAIGTSAYAPRLTDWPNGGVVGLHGTSLPQLVPGRPSHGCIRVRNAGITKLYRRIGLGTPVWIR
jgi:hypothetical protein